MNMLDWRPATEGAGFVLPKILSPLAPFRDQILVLTGMMNREADATAGEGVGDHSRAQATFLTGVRAKKTEGADIRAGVSMDQIAAREFGKVTELSSLELALEASDLVGGCEDGYSCAYSGTLAWSTPTTPLPMEAEPRAVFERLFGASGSTDRQARLQRIHNDRSILDVVTDQLQRLQSRLGPSDQVRITQFFDAVRDVERRIQRAEEQSERGDLPAAQRPGGIPNSFEEYAKLMLDLMVLAYQCDLTRVSTFLVGREKDGRSYPEIGVPDPHHPVSHHQNRPELLEKLTKINVFHMQIFAHFLENLRSTPDGDGSLLDHVMILHGGGISNSDTHSHHDLPVMLVGGGAGQIKGGRHVRVGEKPLANLHLTLLDKLGIPVDRLGDSTGQIELVSGV
jgi:hypothetical protein